MYCSKCGKHLEQGATYCDRCGKGLKRMNGYRNYNKHGSGNYNNQRIIPQIVDEIKEGICSFFEFISISRRIKNFIFVYRTDVEYRNTLNYKIKKALIVVLCIVTLLGISEGILKFSEARTIEANKRKFQSGSLSVGKAWVETESGHAEKYYGLKVINCTGSYTADLNRLLTDFKLEVQLENLPTGVAVKNLSILYFDPHSSYRKVERIENLECEFDEQTNTFIVSGHDDLFYRGHYVFKDLAVYAKITGAGPVCIRLKDIQFE